MQMLAPLEPLLACPETVLDFVDSGAHPIVRVVAPDGHERLIPWVAQYVLGVDVDARRIDVDWSADY